MRALVLVPIAMVAAGCTSVKMVQRDGCWIKRTEKIFGRVREEIGPCMRAPPKWVEDRPTRLVQECVAQADYRWQVGALEAWSKAKPYPPQAPQEEILRTCMEEARVGLLNERDELKQRVTEISAERDTLRTSAEQERAHLREANERLAGFLGEAAKKPPGNATATATATSDGKATNESGTTLASESRSGSGTSGAPAITAAAPKAAKIARARRPRVVQATRPADPQQPAAVAAPPGAPCAIPADEPRSGEEPRPEERVRSP